MRVKNLISLALAALLLVSLSLPALADGSVEITTTIPSSHTVTVVCGTGGKVTVDGAKITGTRSFTVTRHTPFSLTAEADDPKHITGITAQSSAGLTLTKDGAEIKSVCCDVTITVTFTQPQAAKPQQAPASTVISPPSPSPKPTPKSTPSPKPIPTAAPEPSPIVTPEPSPQEAPRPAPDPVTPPDPAPPAPTPTTGNVPVPVVGKDKGFESDAQVLDRVAKLAVDEERLEELLSSDSTAERVTIDVSAAGEDINAVVIPVSTVEAVARQVASEDNDLTTMDIALAHTTVTFDAGALDSIVQQAEADTITLRVTEIAAEELNATQQLSVASGAEAGNVVIVQVTLLSGSTHITDFGSGVVEVSMPYTPSTGEDTETISVWFVAENGDMERMSCRYESGFVKFSVSHFSNYLIRRGDMALPDVLAPPNLPEETPTVGFPWLAMLLAMLAILTAIFLFVKPHRRRE